MPYAKPTFSPGRILLFNLLGAVLIMSWLYPSLTFWDELDDAVFFLTNAWLEDVNTLWVTIVAATNHRLFDVFILDRSQQADPQVMEAAAAQCLLLTGFFRDQMRFRHNIAWYAALGAGFYDSAAHLGGDRSWTRMMEQMALRFEFWRRQLYRLAQELRDAPRLVVARGPANPMWN